jgi:hypothetical protein
MGNKSESHPCGTSNRFHSQAPTTATAVRGLTPLARDLRPGRNAIFALLCILANRFNSRCFVCWYYSFIIVPSVSGRRIRPGVVTEFKANACDEFVQCEGEVFLRGSRAGSNKQMVGGLKMSLSCALLVGATEAAGIAHRNRDAFVRGRGYRGRKADAAYRRAPGAELPPV